MSRAALCALLALSIGCKKDAERQPHPLAEKVPGASSLQPEPTPATQPTPGPTQPSPPTAAVPAPPEAPVTTTPAPSGWARRTGPGFTVDAPGDATKSHVEATQRDPAADVYTFHRTDDERYEVLVIPVQESLSRAIATLRDRISFSSTQVRHEDYLPAGIGDATGIDIAYIVSDGDAMRYARSRLIGAKGIVYNVRAYFPKQREDVAAKFVESFALTKTP